MEGLGEYFVAAASVHVAFAIADIAITIAGFDFLPSGRAVVSPAGWMDGWVGKTGVNFSFQQRMFIFHH